MPKLLRLQRQSDRDNPTQLSWGSMFGAIRPVLGVLVFTAVALLIPPQTADMLAILSEETWRGIWSAFVFHLSLFLLAFAAWHWSRALLSARFGATDSGPGRSAVVAQGGGSGAALEWGRG